MCRLKKIIDVRKTTWYVFLKKEIILKANLLNTRFFWIFSFIFFSVCIVIYVLPPFFKCILPQQNKTFNKKVQKNSKKVLTKLYCSIIMQIYRNAVHERRKTEWQTKPWETH
nr:MAG TPA: hypothetical protein [Caudoviricetes sp.]